MKSRKNWSSLPGGWDALHLEHLYFEGDYPEIYSDVIPIKSCKLVAIHDNNAIKENCFVHSFVNDYLQERFWNCPGRYVEKFKKCAAVMSPDFSLLLNMPKPLQTYNVYRNRYVGFMWQIAGVKIIPTVTWSDKDSFEFCFNGIGYNSVVAVSNIGCKTEQQKKYFDAGYNEMIDRINPKKIIFMCVKKLIHEYENERVIFIDSHFDKKRKQWAEESEMV